MSRILGAASAWTAHAFAWAAGIWLAFGPAYEGVSGTAALPGEPGGEATRFTATLIEVNGLYVIWLLAVPILLTGVPLLVIRRPAAGRVGRKILLWVPAAALLGFCAMAIFSIGLFYLPAALALITAAATDSTGRTSDV